MPVRPGSFTVPPLGEFGASRLGGRRHNGWDQYAPRGTSIFAAFDGVVTRVANNPDTTIGFGYNVTVRNHHDEYSIIDAHMLGPALVRVGEEVYGNVTQLGDVGNTGNAIRVATHTHVQIRQPNGLLVNPSIYLPRFAPALVDVTEPIAPLETEISMHFLSAFNSEGQLEYFTFDGHTVVEVPAGEEDSMKLAFGRSKRVTRATIQRLRQQGARHERAAAL